MQSSVSHITTEDIGGSPELRGKIEQECNNESVVPTAEESSPKHNNYAAEKKSVAHDFNNISGMVKPENKTARSNWTQNTLTFQPRLPKDVEEVLSRYCMFNPNQDAADIAPSTSPLSEKLQPISRSYSKIASLVSALSGGDEANNLSNSTLSRKLSEGILNDDDGDAENYDNV